MDHVKQFRAWADAFEHEGNRALTVEDIACISGDDLPGDLRSAADEIERLKAVADAARELRKAEYDYHAAISCDEISQTARLGNITREARVKLDALLLKTV